MFNILNPYFGSGYLPSFGVRKEEADSFIGNLESKFFRNVINITAAAALIPETEEDYVGTWEDAFLFTGYENGKHRVLTPIVANILGRHGFDVRTTNHYPKYRQPSIGGNEIIVGLAWKDEACIPSRDINGNTVRVGITDPRKYLPEVVQKLFDLEFGYDKELFGKETVERQIVTIS